MMSKLVYDMIGCLRNLASITPLPSHIEKYIACIKYVIQRCAFIRFCVSTCIMIFYFQFVGIHICFDSLLFLFISFSMFFVLIHDYTLCFTGSPCCKFSIIIRSLYDLTIELFIRPSISCYGLNKSLHYFLVRLGTINSSKYLNNILKGNDCYL